MENKILIEYEDEESAEKGYEEFMKKFSNHLNDKNNEKKRKQIGKRVIITNIKHGANLSTDITSTNVLEGAVSVRIEKNLGDVVVLSKYELSGTALIVGGSEEDKTLEDFLEENNFSEIMNVSDRNDLFR